MSQLLKDTNKQNLRAGKPFKYPDFPPPYDDYPNCRITNAERLFPDYPTDDCGFPIVVSDDPYSEECLNLVDRAVTDYRGYVDYPAYSNRICDYPTPHALHASTRALGYEQSFAQLESTTGFLIEWIWDYVLPTWELRVFCAELVTHRRNPIDIVWRLRNKPLEKPTGYLLAIVKSVAGDIPKRPSRRSNQQFSSHTVPTTDVQRPDLSDVIEGWKYGVPDYDSVFSSAALSAALSDSGLTPVKTLDEWITEVAQDYDPIRAKRKASKF